MLTNESGCPDESLTVPEMVAVACCASKTKLLTFPPLVTLTVSV